MEQPNFLMMLFGPLAQYVCADSPKPHTTEPANYGKLNPLIRVTSQSVLRQRGDLL